MPTAIARPTPDEYAPYYATYIDKVPDGNLVEMLRRQHEEFSTLVRGLSAAQADHRYAPGKWTIREVVGHVADAERIFQYRMLRFARNDPTPLASFDENVFVANARFAQVPLADLVDELTTVRAASLSLLQNLSPDELARSGTASGRPFTVRALAWIIAGHQRHHMQVLKERYLND
jgi:uncharacterized damage-inducible protein DinB